MAGSSSEEHIVATLYPKKEKLDRFKELMKQLSTAVHSKEESAALRYILTEKLGASEPEFIVIETYKDHAAVEQHGKTEHFKEIFGTFEKEGVFAKPAVIAVTKSVHGFDRDRALL